jgi:two-component system chemotaxis response regulator CheB
MQALAARDGEERPVRVLVVDDSPLCRDLLSELLAPEAGLELVGTAVDGADALRQVRALRPDVITMDLRMPVMDGIESTAAIMAEQPTPILVLTGHPFQSGRNMTFDAIRAGALDLMIKPDLGNVTEVRKLRENLSRLLRFLARIEVKVHPRREETLEATPAQRRHVQTVAIAASAGGPRAVHEVLCHLPADFPASIVVVQHIAEGFDQEFASWLDSECALKVKLAEHDDELLPGRVLIAPSEAHVRVMPAGTVKLIHGSPIGGYRPSADVLLSSVARSMGEQACGLILSGMGEDGVAGLADIRKMGGLTMAQDEGSCVVYGMPGEAVARGLVDRVLPLDRIGPELLRCCPKTAREGA